MDINDLHTDIKSMKEHFLPFSLGDNVKYLDHKGKIIKIEPPETFVVELDNGFWRWLTAEDMEKI